MNSYTNSVNWFKDTIDIIPTASQTFSKSHYSLPFAAAPLFSEKANKSYIYDIDNNKYIDLVSGLLSISLGYRDKHVDKAIKKQLKKGINFSLPHKLERRLAERLIHLIPCAEMVRFGKNGSDVTTAAIRLARAYTGRDKVAVCGYHGWHDWYIGSTTRDLGVPASVKALTCNFSYNDLDSLKKIISENPNEISAVIMEPMNIEYPNAGFLEGVRNLTRKYGIVLIFDEIITGFRFDIGGAQSLFGVTPDLATFGKSMGNGMPISAIVGQSDIMRLMDDIFFSGTFGGEALSLAASVAVIDKYIKYDVIGDFKEKGFKLAEGINAAVEKHNINWFELKGHDSWKIYNVSSSHNIDATMYKTLLIQYLCENGVLTIGSNNINYALKNSDINKIIKAFNIAFEKINQCQKSGDIEQFLYGEKISQVFKVR